MVCYCMTSKSKKLHTALIALSLISLLVLCFWRLIPIGLVGIDQRLFEFIYQVVTLIVVCTVPIYVVSIVVLKGAWRTIPILGLSLALVIALGYVYFLVFPIF